MSPEAARARSRILAWASLMLLVAVALTDIAFAARQSLGLPHADDWDALGPRALPAGFTWSWIFTPHHGHQNLPTKLQVWLLHACGGWDLRVHHASNQLLWSGVIAALAVLLRQASGIPLAALTPFLLLLYATDASSIQLAWQSTVHFSLLFSFTATALLFDERQRDRDLALGTAAAWLAVFSYGAGLVYVLTLLPFFAAFKLSRAAAAPPRRRVELGRLSAVVAALAGATALWQRLTPSLPEAVWPPLAPGEAVDLWSGLLAQGFGWASFPSAAAGPVIVALVLAPSAAAAWKARDRLSSGGWALCAAGSGVLAVLTSMILARGGNAQSWIPLASIVAHYALIAHTLVALCAAGWWLTLRDSPRAAGAALCALWLVCAAGQARSGFHSLVGPTAAASSVRRYHLVDLTRSGTNDTRYPLAAARRLDLPFSRSLNASAAEPPRASSFALVPGSRLSAAPLGPFLLLLSSDDTRPRLPFRGPHINYSDTALLRFERPDAAPDLTLARAGGAPRGYATDGLIAALIPMASERVLSPRAAPLAMARRMKAPQPTALGPVLARLPPPLQARHRLRSTPLFVGETLAVGLLEVGRETTWERGKGRVLLAARGEATVRVGGETLISKPGVFLHLPAGSSAHPVITPRPGPPFVGVWFEALQSH